MALEAGLYHDHDAAPPGSDELHTFASDVDTALSMDIQSLRDPTRPTDTVPSLRADQRALVAALQAATAGHDPAQHDGYLPVLVTAETDRLTDSINSVSAIVRKGATQTPA